MTNGPYEAPPLSPLVLKWLNSKLSLPENLLNGLRRCSGEFYLISEVRKFGFPYDGDHEDEDDDDDDYDEDDYDDEEEDEEEED